MGAIDRTGTFRGSILDYGLATTKNGYPQLVMALRGEEYYDEDEKLWVSWEGVEESDITAYLVLFGGDQVACLSLKQLQKALGWDGLSFASLAKIDHTKIKIQFRVETNLYEGNTTLKVNWVNVYDAEPGRIISKLSDDDVKKLDAQYVAAFKKLSGGQTVKPVSASDLPWTGGAKTIVPPTDNRPDLPEPVKPTKTVKPPKTAKPKPTSPGVSPAPKPGCTADEAWAACIAAKAQAVTEDKLAEIWVETVSTIAPDKDENKMTPELWIRVRDIVSERVKDTIPF